MFAGAQKIKTEASMNHEFEMLDQRISRLERKNRRLRWLAIAVAALGLASRVWGQAAGNTPVQAQKFELRDGSGRLRAELAILNGGPALRFFDADGDVECLLGAYSFSIFKKGGDNQAVFARDGLEFGDGRDRTFVGINADEAGQVGKLRLNDYRKKIYTTIVAEDLATLRPAKNQ